MGKQIKTSNEQVVSSTDRFSQKCLLSLGDFYVYGLIDSNLTEEEAFAAQASLIDAFNYVSDVGLTNIAARHHSAEALYVDIFEKQFDCNDLKNHVFIIENHKYNQKMGDFIINNTPIVTWG